MIPLDCMPDITVNFPPSPQNSADSTPECRLSRPPVQYLPMPSANTSATSVLKKASIFSGLNEQEFAFLAARAVQRGFSAGKLIFSEGEPCTELYVVQAGTGGREQARSTVRLGGSVADLPVFDG